LKKTLFLLFTLYTCLSFSQEEYTLMFYNLLDFPEAPPSNRNAILKDILVEIEPDIFMVCELQNATAADLILSDVLNEMGETTYAMPNFVINTSSGFQDLQQHLYYDESKFSLLSTDIIETQLRDINYYQLEALQNEEATPLILDIFVAHLKAAQGQSNELIRSEMVTDFTNYLANLPDDANVIFAGDFNFYTANESAFLQLVMGQSNILFSDPINQVGDWNNNTNFSHVHTQSTRTSNNNFDDYGAGGGLDDRFDFIMLSNNIMDENNSIAYKENSYIAYGNNGNCFNKNISDTSCNGIFSQSTRNLLYNMSDHLPVVLKLENNNTSLSAANWSSSELLSFPNGNLVHNQLHLEFHTSISEKTEILIFDSLGKQLLSVKTNSSIAVIDVSNFSKGVYFIKIPGYTKTYPFVVAF